MASGDTQRHRVVVRLNQQQMELVDRTIAGGLAQDREQLLRLALTEYAERHGGRTDD
ncbi:hypothetical protein [Roseibium sp. Sym1]|uniref:hypothetical protein n=1 Tax=Roseibium sp. Sym1 TaxID=3016006 RepID=UPI0022B5B901|nr:hypothetical protein [Roseibium sp. Sym1]